MKYHGSLKVKIFEISDYGLNKDERREKYKDYYVLLCEKCNQEVNKRDYKCNYCYNKETDPNEKFRMRLGSCKECHQVNEYSVGFCDISLDILNDYINQKQAEEQKNPSYNFDETIDTTLKKNPSITIETHSEANYTSGILDLPPNLPEPTNWPNQQEFISSRIYSQDLLAKNLRSECLECMVY
ncbi:7898_t:CDS:2 [Rhizophagus irregularis]|nr:7898_t:CDS:2 [Rhizophagus irregularis]